jgi:hypothetical protein
MTIRLKTQIWLTLNLPGSQSPTVILFPLRNLQVSAIPIVLPSTWSCAGNNINATDVNGYVLKNMKLRYRMNEEGGYGRVGLMMTGTVWNL